MVSPFEKRHLSLMALAGILAVLVCVISPAVPHCQAEAGPQENDTDEAAPPKVVFSSVTWDAGQVERGALITHEFTFRNTGGSDLVILSTKAG